MVKLTTSHKTFVHGSDIQLLDDQAVEIICRWQPDIVFFAGPPLYLFEHRRDIEEKARERLVRLSSACGTVVVDHHLLRSRGGEAWLDSISQQKEYQNICCAADFISNPRALLEADRKILYND